MSASVADNASEREMIEFSEDEHLSFFYNIDQIYTELPGVISNYGTFAQSLLICRQLSNQIIRNSIAEAQERFILRNIPINAINELQAQTNLILNCNLNDGGIEEETCQLDEDQEPVLNNNLFRNQSIVIDGEGIEFQLCQVILIFRYLIFIEVESQEKEDIDDKLNNDNRKSISKSKLFDTRKNTVRLPTTPPPPSQMGAKLIQVYQEEFEDEFEDKLRNAKLYEMKKKNEIEQKKKEDKLQSQQIEKKDGATQKYTYDFDGKIILARAIKMDKLQPTNQKLRVELKDQTKQDQQPSVKKGGRRDSTKVNKPQCPEQEIPNRVIQERRDAAKEVIGDKALRIDKTSQFPYEVFTMNNGVKLYYEQKMKEGVRHQISDSAENLQIKLSGSNLVSGDDASQFASQIRLTKAEYQLITDAQTLQQARQQFLPSENINIPDNDQQVTQQSILLKKNKANLNIANHLTDSKQVQFNAGMSQLNPFKRESPILQSAQTERIQLKNVKMIENLLVTGVPDTPKSSKPDQPPTFLPDNASTNPIDLFNQQLLTQKEWGKQGGGKTSYFPPVKQQKRSLETKAYKGSLEQMYKMPRERLVAQTGRTAMNFYKQNSDGAKKIGKSVSDGFMQTFYTTHSKFSEKLRQ